MKPRLLIVDDDEQVRQVIADQLIQYGLEVSCCSDAFHALGVLYGLREEFDLLLFDLVMPGMDGGTLTKIVRAVQFADKDGKRTPVILFSGFSPDRVEAKGVQQRTGCDEFLPKPLSPHELVTVIRRYLTF